MGVRSDLAVIANNIIHNGMLCVSQRGVAYLRYSQSDDLLNSLLNYFFKSCIRGLGSRGPGSQGPARAGSMESD